MMRGKSHQRSSSRTSGENAAGDGAGFFPHLGGVLFGGYILQIHRGHVEDCGEAGGVGRLLHQRAANHGGALVVQRLLDSRDLLGNCGVCFGFLESVVRWRDLS